MANILALDQSSRITGWAIFENKKLKSYGKFDASKFSDDLADRLWYIRNQVKQLIEEYNITEVIMEDIQMQSNTVNNVKTFKVLAEVFGVISEMLYELKLPQSAILASSWKSALGIKGRARAEQKQNAQKWVEENYQIKPTQDECDAICIGASQLKATSCAF